MIKHLISCMVVIGLSACATTGPSAPEPEREPTHILIDVQGEVRLNRATWSDGMFVPAPFGTALHPGDLLRLSDIAQATVVCADLTVRPIRPGTGSIPCPDAPPVLRYQERQISTVRAPVLDIPQVIAPRGTKILDPRPTIRWRAVPGVSTYTVRIEGTNWITEVQDATELVYPAAAPALQPGITYKVIVAAGERDSTAERMTGLGFTLLSVDEAQTVRAAEAKIRALSLSDQATGVLIANLYAGNDLYAEAIAQLERLSVEADGPVLLRLIADRYMQSGLSDYAKRYYQIALDRTAPDDVESQADIHAALTQIALSDRDQDAAQNHMTQARAGYEQLGDQAALRELDLLAGQVK